MHVALVLWLSIVGQAADERQQALRIDRDERLDAGGALRVEHVTSMLGTLSVWAESDELDLVLRVEPAGQPALEDDDTGGGPNPWLRIPSIGAGERFAFIVSAKSPQRGGAVRLSVREMPETDASRIAFEQAGAAFAEAKALDASGERRRAVEVLARAIDAYGARSDLYESASFHAELLRLSRLSAEWLDYDTFRRTALIRRDAMRGLFPRTSEAWSEVQLAVCQGLTRSADPSSALPECDEALRMALRCFPAEHENIAVTRFTVGQAYHEARDLERASQMLELALTEATRNPKFDEVRLAILRSELATAKRDLGELPQALALQRLALETIERRFPPDHDVTLAMLNNMAVVLNAMGENSRSLEIYQRCCETLATRLPLDHPEYIGARGNRAVVRLALGDAERAAKELEEVVASQQRAGLSANEDADQLEVNLAEAWIASGRAEEALQRVRARIELRRSVGRSDVSMSWRLESTLAHALRALGRDRETLESAERALVLAERAFPIENPDLAETRQLVAALRVRTGQLNGARELAESAARQTQAYFARCASVFTMQDAERAQQHWSRLVSDGVTLLDATRDDAHGAASDRAAFELCESARAIGTLLLRSWRAQGTENSSAFEALRVDALRAAREVARIASHSSDSGALDAALETRRRAEEALRLALHLDASDTKPAPLVDTPTIAASLAPGQALIAFWRLDHRAAGAPQGAPREPRMLAFVLRGDGRVRRHDLGDLAAIASACESWRRGTHEAPGATARAGDTLRQLVLDPLASSLAGATHWRVAPDDVLHSVALDALPEGDARVGDRARIVVVVRASAEPTRALGGGGARLVAVGGVDYEAALDETETTRSKALGRAGGERWLGAKRPSFAPLWETQDEIDGVASLFRRYPGATADPERSVTLLTEGDASRAELLTQAAGATHLHIATHGFFALEFESEGPRSDKLARRSPLTLCGLALAGANDVSAAADGVVTADELALLDLRRCELVVLSACDTNVGASTAGQGVASFQKALHAAGAKAVVTSLWKVSDEAARELMLAFYEAHWRDGLPAEQALWLAKRKLRERRAPERDWAGWVLSSL